jgi:hypothetical protein
MDPGYFTVLAIVVAGLVYSLYRGRRPSPSGRSGGWFGLTVLAVLFAGLFISARLGSELLTWLFGLSLMAIVPIMFFLAVGSAIGQRLGRHKGEGSDERGERQ